MKIWLALSSSAWIRLLSSTSIFLWRIKDSPAILENHFISFCFVSPSSCITTLTYAAQHCLLLISNHIRCSSASANLSCMKICPSCTDRTGQTHPFLLATGTSIGNEPFQYRNFTFLPVRVIFDTRRLNFFR